MKTPKQTQKRIKTTYVPPRIISYEARTLLRQLGPARAYSSTRSIDDELLGIDH